MMNIIAASRLRGETAQVYVGGAFGNYINNQNDLLTLFNFESYDVFDFQSLGSNNLKFKTRSKFDLENLEPREKICNYLICESDLFKITISGTFFSSNTIISFSHFNTGHTFGAAGFRNSSLRFGFFEFATILGRPNTFDNLSNCRIYLNNVVTVAENVNVVGVANNVKFYVNNNVSQEIIDSLSANGATTIFIQNYSKPDSVNNLFASNISGRNITLDFDQIPNADFYEVWILDELNEGVYRCIDEITSSTQIVEMPRNNTNYKVKIATCDQYWNGSGFFKDENKRAFSNEITIQTL